MNGTAGNSVTRSCLIAASVASRSNRPRMSAAPERIAASSALPRPWAWNRATTARITSCSVTSTVAANWSASAARLRFVRIMPLGVPVDPDENANSAGAAGSTVAPSNGFGGRRCAVECGEVLDPWLVLGAGRCRPAAQHRHEVGLGDDPDHGAAGRTAAGQVTSQLLGREQWVQRHCHRTEHLDGEERGHEGAVVAEHYGDAVAGRDPAGVECAGQTAHVAGELIPRATFRSVDQRQAITDPLDRGREHRRHGRRALAHDARRSAM